MSKVKKFVSPNVVDLLALAVIAIFFAFVRIEAHYGFEFDQERDYNVIREIVINRNHTLIGPRVVSSAGFFLGPYYYYLNVPFFIIFGGEPSFAAYFTAFINLAVCFLIYLFLKRETQSRLLALSAAVLWISGANRSSWNVSFVPLFFLGFLHLFYRRSTIFLTLLFSFSLHFHAQMIFLAPLWLYLIFSSRPTARQLFQHILIFLISFLPLVLFDFRHHFLNTRAFIKFVTQTSPATTDVSAFRPLYSLRQFSTGLIFLHPIFKHNLVLTTALLGGLIFFALFVRRYLPILVVILVSLILLGFYKELTWPEYYHYLSSLSVLLLTFILANKLTPIKWLLLTFVALTIYHSYFTAVFYTDPSSYYHKKALVLYLLNQNQPYAKLNIDNDFRFGDGLGFGPIREYYEKKEGEYHPTLRFYVSYADSPKHNQTKRTFGLYGVSMVESIASQPPLPTPN